MATRKTPAPTQANLTPQQMKKGIARINRVIAEIEDFDATGLTQRWGPEQKALEATIEGALASIFGHETVEYRRYARATQLDHGGVSVSFGGRNMHEESRKAREYVSQGKIAAVEILKSAVKWLNEELSDSTEADAAVTESSAATAAMSRKIFIVHGHDVAAQQALARFIERLEFEAIILSERPSQGRTIIEKIEAHSDVGFAVVLLTPDDVGGKTPDTLKPRARQNVLLELGYFMSLLGRRRVCTLAKGNLEIPTDFAGMVWTDMDDAGAWKVALARELDATGYNIDWKKAMS